MITVRTRQQELAQFAVADSEGASKGGRQALFGRVFHIVYAQELPNYFDTGMIRLVGGALLRDPSGTTALFQFV